MSWQWWCACLGLILVAAGAAIAFIGFRKTWSDFVASEKFWRALIKWLPRLRRKVKATVGAAYNQLIHRKRYVSDSDHVTAVDAEVGIRYGIQPSEFPADRELPEIVRTLWERHSVLELRLGDYMQQAGQRLSAVQEGLGERVTLVNENVVKVVVGGLSLQAWGLILVTVGTVLSSVPALAQVSSVPGSHVTPAPPTSHDATHAAGFIWTGDFSAAVTAIATAVLAAFAIVTAILAYLAFRKQAQEVHAIERQVSDQQRLTQQQAELIRIQSEQLAEQRKMNEEQLRVLALQAEELRESLAERKREAMERRNAQGAQTHIVLKVVHEDGELGGPAIQATLVNACEGQQPAYDAKLYWHLGRDSYGTPNPEPLGTVLNWEKESRTRTFPRGADPAACGAVLSFRDAFGVDWVKTPDGGAMHADSDLVPDIVKSLARTSPDGTSPRL